MSPSSLASFFTSPPADLNTCDREPIHIPGAIQGHGLLVVLDEALTEIRQVSANVEPWFGLAPSVVVGQPPAILFGDDGVSALKALHAEMPPHGGCVGQVVLNCADADVRPFHVALHVNEAGVLAELEPVHGVESASLMGEVETTVQRLTHAPTLQAWCDVIAAEVQRLTGFGRVMVYRFDADWHGQVVAEACLEGMESFAGLHFPAGDIPRQARLLYVLNPLRYIADVAYAPVPVVPPYNPTTGVPLDLSHSQLRSVSPIHIEYLRNMGVGASMSISIVRDGQLWGLVACHHGTPHRLPPSVRVACSLLGQILTMQLPHKLADERLEREEEVRAVHEQLLAQVQQTPSLASALAEALPTMLDLVAAQGAAVVEEGAVTLIGKTPDDALVQRIVDYLATQGDDGVYATDRLPSLMDEPALQPFASGLLALPIGARGQGWLMWFREEKVRSVVWAGDRTQAKITNPDERISPRKSFAQWKEIVCGTAVPWHPSEVAAAEALYDALVDLALRRVQATTLLNRELEKANRALEVSNRELQEFASVVAHDLKEPLRKISTLAGLVDADFAADIPEEGRYFLRRLQQAALRMMTLVNDMLALSQATSRNGSRALVDLNDVLGEVQYNLRDAIAASGAQIHVEPLPHLVADRAQLVLMVQHLVTNALRFQPAGQVPVVHVSGTEEPGGVRVAEGIVVGPAFCLTIADNGLGFDGRHAARIFKPFQRLHSNRKYEGNGIGLALCRRIAERHGGFIRATSVPGEGSKFTVCLPQQAD